MSITKIKSSNIKDSSIVNADFNPTTNIPDSQITGVDTALINDNAFNIGLLGFKMAVNDGLTLFNLVDGVVDEFNDESGVDTAENSNTTYDSTSDFYNNFLENSPIPTPQIGRTSITSTGAGTYSVEPTTSAVDVLVIGGGGGGGAGGYNNTSGGGGGAGGLIFYEDYPVTGGSSIPVSVGAGAEVVEVRLQLLLGILVVLLAHMKLHLMLQLLSTQQKLLIFIIQQNLLHINFIIRLVKKEQTQFLVQLQL